MSNYKTSFLLLDFDISHKICYYNTKEYFMEKQDIKNILISIRTPENEAQVNLLLGQIDMMSKKNLDQSLATIGNSQKNIKTLFQKKIQSLQLQANDERIAINTLFTYGIDENCIHLHLPGNFHNLIASIGLSKTVDTVCLYLLDALNQIKNLKETGFYKFSDIDSIYMISQILPGKPLKFLNSMDFETNFFKKSQLQDHEFLKEHSEAQLATQLFGNNKNVGTASIKLDTLFSPEWQEKCKNKIKEFQEKGIILTQTEYEKE